MLKAFIATLAVAAAVVLQQASAHKAATAIYMQIFYEGPGWLSGRRVLSYSPAFHGKTEELVQEPDSVRQLAPDALLDGGTGQLATTTYATVSTGQGTLLPDANGKMHPETATDRRLAQQRATAQRNRLRKLTEMRSDLAKTALTNALNEAAAAGWEVVQLAPSGSPGGLVYLLRHR